MKTVPVIPHFKCDPPSRSVRAVARLARALRAERPELALPDLFQELALDRLDDGPTLHLDDLSEIPWLDRGRDVRFYQDRACLRAGDADLIATCADPVPGFETYCRDHLGLGSPTWLRPRRPRLGLRIAEACWEDVGVRDTLIEKLRRDELRYVHPHMGTFSVWELAFLLQDEVQRPIKVVAPPPGVSRWANDKIAFASAVSRLLGPAYLPRTESASNLAYVAKRVQELAGQFEMIGLKLPNSGGGDGNLVLRTAPFRGRSLRAIHEIVKEHLTALAWDGSSPLLIDGWETEVVCAPSAQLWIPPLSDGAPVIEGIFVQAIEGPQGSYVGNAPAFFPAGLNQEIADQSWLLARLFQTLGYVGRCSFDMVLVGQSLSECRVEFIECNGRWGGTSLPMTLMNRVFGDWAQQPYAVQVAHRIDGLEQVSFAQLLEFFGDELFDVRTGNGSLMFVTPGRLRYQAGITAIALGATWDEAAQRAGQLPDRLRRLAQCTPGDPARNQRPSLQK